MPINADGKVILSYSAYSDYMECPYKYYMGKILRAPREDDDESFTIPGKIVHKATEDFLKDFSDTHFDKALLESKLLEADNTPKVNLKRAFGSVDKAKDTMFKASDNLYRFLIGQDLQNKPYLSEHWFGSWDNPLHIIDNLYTQGAADLIVDNPNGTSILYDYKTTWSDKNLHIEQLMLYRLAYRKLLGKNITMCSFFLLPVNRHVYYNFNLADEIRLVEAMNAASANITAGNFPTKPNAKCERCPFKTKCPDSKKFVKVEKVPDEIFAGFGQADL